MEPDTDPQKLKKVVKKVGAEFMEHPVHGPSNRSKARASTLSTTTARW